MIKVYSSPSVEMVHLAKNVLENSGIECTIRGENLAAASGGIAPVDAWAELWVLSENQADDARRLVDKISNRPIETGEAWICSECVEWRQGQFSHCWKCGAERLT